MPALRTTFVLGSALMLVLTARAQTMSATLGDFLLERQREFMTPSAVFCAAEIPEQAADFQQANERFRGVAVEATKGLRDRLGTEALAKPVPASAMAFDPAQTFVDQGRAQGADKFCPQVLRMMRTTTVEALRQVTANAFARMEAAAAARNQSSGAGK